MSKVVIIGGGIIGLSSAYFLHQLSYDVTVMDRGNLEDNCSYGNAGYVCPSHFVPLASPGIVKQGLKWMFNSRSPFYIQPRINKDLFNWAIHFIKNSSVENVKRSAVPLRDIALISQRAYEEWDSLPGFNFSYMKKGLLDAFQTEKGEHHAQHLVKAANELGLETLLLTKNEVEKMEPNQEMDIKGAVYFKCDGHLTPNLLMKDLIKILQEKGVKFLREKEIINLNVKENTITSVSTADEEFYFDHFIISNGVWSRELAKKLKINLPMVGGRGYSFNLDNAEYNFNYPIILHEGKVAVTPMDDKVRFGGTMEITAENAPVNLNRVTGITDSVRRFFPGIKIPELQKKDIWSGYRPCSADGLPYIGNSSLYKNLTIATGHSMLGLSLGAGTGKLVSQIIHGDKPEMDISIFNPERFN
jgi:D-amino-acid dehydrogenase